VTEDRWIACAVRDEIAFGLKAGGELKVETTICDEIRGSGKAVIIDHVAEDPGYRAHHTPAMYGFQSYISMPIFRADQSFFGTLCAIDPKPAKLNRPEIIGMFKLFADLVAFHLDSIDAVARSDALLFTERQGADLREQFIAVLGHDLRNPLAAIEGGTRLLQKESLSSKGTTVLGLMQGSVRRMSGLIDNVLDLTRARLGGGIGLNRVANAPLEKMLNQVVDETKATWPDHKIETHFALANPVNCDPGRVGQMLSNLMANAVKHGAKGSPIVVEASSEGDVFEMSVANNGPPIPPDVAERLFQPFFRAPGQQSNEGLGLGLYIVSEVARAHGGTVIVNSTDSETRFTVRFPRAA
jgi:signal transduction histidine kinase